MHYCRSYGVGNVEGKEIEYLHSTIVKIDIRFSEQLRYKMVVFVCRGQEGICFETILQILDRCAKIGICTCKYKHIPSACCWRGTTCRYAGAGQPDPVSQIVNRKNR